MTDDRIQFTSTSAEQTQAIAAALAGCLKGGDVITLEGELGAGKTTFVRGLAQGLGIAPRQVSSPTFIIRQEYTTPQITAATSIHRDVQSLIHFDAYRISPDDDLETIGWNDAVHGKIAVVAVEWPQRLPQDTLPTQCIRVELWHLDHTSRQITIVAPENIRTRLAAQSLSVASSARCRKCGKIVKASAATFPFCSERCKLAELGDWFSGKYRVSRQVESDQDSDS